MKHFYPLFLFVATVAAAPFGTYTNEAEGFARESLVLTKDGKGFYAMMAGVPVLWSYNETTNEITITGNLGNNLKVESVVFQYDTNRDIIITKQKATPGDGFLACVQKSVDERIQKALDSFDWNLKNHEIK